MRLAPMRSTLLVTAVTLTACSGDSLSPRDWSARPTLTARANAEIDVSTASSLYMAVNDPANAGRRIVLAPGTYMLDGSQPNGGRIELQSGMTLAGQPGRPDAVIIDASNLSAAALTSGTQLTGAVRVGRGSNAVEWLTIRNAVNGAAAIATDLFLAGATTVTIAHVVASGSPRGFDVRNVGAVAAGRVLEVVLTDNELANNSSGSGQGIRVANLQGADGARIHATLSGNYAHGNIAGCLAANVNSDAATVEIESNGDRFDDNGNGCVLLGGNATGAGFARRNTVRFSAQTSSFEHNLGSLPAVFPTRAGVAAYGAVATAANRASDNRVELDLHSARISDNGGPDVAAWGAITAATQPAGTGNVVSIVLRGSSKKATVDATDSAPSVVGSSNQVTIVR